MYTCARICIKVHFSFYFLLKMVKIHVLIACLLMANYFMLHQAIIPPQNLTTDLSALLEFKSHISLDPFGFLDNWSSTTFVCNWTGISCAFKSQRVTALNLSNWSLRGIIPPHLGNLTFLTSLDFSHNNFSGFIPLQLANLISLKQMNVGYNNLSGEIPSWFGNLQEIRFLLLNNNAFSGAIPLSLGNISNLEKLNLGYNLLEGNIPKGIGNLSNLRTLTFRGNQLTGSIPSGIFNISLEEIDFAENSLSGTLPIDICNHQLKQIKGLNLSVNQFQGEIPSELYNCRDLEHVSLSYNQFNGRIPRTLGYLVKLKDLSLGGNIFTGGIPMEIGNLSSMQILNLQSSFLTGTIPWPIFNISSLRVMDLSNNSLTGSLPLDKFYNLPALKELHLSTNQLIGSIPSFIWECKTLETLDLSKNNFTGGIANRVGNLTSVQNLLLDYNMLTGELPSEIGNPKLETLYLGSNNLAGHVHPQVFNMSSLSRMSLDENNFNGSLPFSMWTTLPNLQVLNLDNNKFTGMISSSISNASKLTFLSLNFNSFTGPLPTTLGKLRFLKRLFVGANNFTRESSTPELKFISSLTNCRELEKMELSLNQFNGFLPTSIGNFSKTVTVFNAFGSHIKGTIPSEIGNISSLESINMDSNEFTGSIPSTIGKLAHLDRIYLEHNGLQGSIPAELCQLKMLGDLYLNENMLTGPIPDCLGELKSLRRVFLHLNNLTSTIPLSFWNLNDLLSLNLSSNSLSGDIPSQIQNLKVIIELDLSWNQLSGDILSSFSAAQSLVFLSLAHNTFRGHIPQSMGNLISLEYLDLSHNDFSGTIPQSLVKLGGLNYFNVSFNRLEGEVPTGGPFANFTAQSFLQNFALCGFARLDLPPCKTKSPSHSGSRNILKYILPPIVFAILIVAIVTFLLAIKRRSREISSEISPGEGSLLQQFYWRRVSYEELLEATDSFSTNYLLGTGSFGSVYKGTLLDGSEVAIKVFHLQSREVTKNFDAECEVLASIRHRNLIRIHSCCVNRDFRAVVLEYMPNGNLEKWLHSENYFLDVVQRFKIIVDVALALEYLHFNHAPAVVHCDLKPGNILLDEDMVAHVCDFGISKIFGNGETMVQTKTLATVGYMAPEYGEKGIVSTSGDVYSFGIILLETFTGKKPTDDIFGEELNLKQWVSKSVEANSVIEVVDRNLIHEEDQNFCLMEQCLLSVLHVGLLCLSDSPHKRINMRNVVTRLENIEVPLVKKL